MMKISNSDLPIISIVTCSYQQGHFLDATMRSVLNQNYSKLNYIVVDGGSKDESRSVITRHADSLDYWVSEKDEGQTDALIKGFSQATGEVMGWLCSDDLLLPDALQKVGEYFRDNPEVDVLYGDSLWIDEEGKPLRVKREMGFNRFVFLHDHNFIPQPSMFWRRSIYDKVGGLDINLHLTMDSDLWARFSDVTDIMHLPAYLSCMRYYPEQKTRSLKSAGRIEDLRILTRGSQLARVPVLRFILRFVARGLRVFYKAISGGYGQNVPGELLPWLQEHATPTRAKDKTV